MPTELPTSVGAARLAGVSRGRLRSLRAPFYGVRADAAPASEAHEADVRRRISEYACCMRDAEFLCLVAAAVEWEVPLPWTAFGRFGDDGEWSAHPLDIGVLLPDRAPRGEGVRGRSISAGFGSVVVHPRTGRRVTSPATTWAMLGARLDRDDLVVLGDAFVREAMREGDPAPLTSIRRLESALAVGRRQGAQALREALPLIRTRSRSRQETRMRLLMLDERMPEPELNWPVVVDGVVIALIDLAYPEMMVAFEYEGEQHLTDPEQWARDIRRYERLASLGWLIIRVTKHDLARDRDAFVARAHAALRARS